MRQHIQFEGNSPINGTLFTSERIYPSSAQFFFPERLAASRVIGALHEFVLSDGLRLADAEQVEPSPKERARGRAAVRANILDEERRSFGYSIATWALEQRFNPAVQQWRANYAGQVRSQESSLYVVTQGDSRYLRDFLPQQSDIVEGVDTVPALANLHFQVRGDEDVQGTMTGVLLNRYAGYIHHAVEAEYGPGALV